MPGWILETQLRQHKARISPGPSIPALCGLFCAVVIACGALLPVTSASAEPRWQNTSWLLADNKYKSQRRSWHELDQKEKQRIYLRHKQFKTWSIEEQQRACFTYFEKFNEMPKTCRKFQ